MLPRRAACALLADANGAVGIDVDGLRKESARVLARAEKKVAKARARAEECEAKQEKLLLEPDAPLSELENLPPCDDLRAAAEAEQSRMAELQRLADGMVELQYTPEAEQTHLLAEMSALASKLGVNDRPPVRPPPRPRKPKGPRPATTPRVPYRTFASAGGAEIRVGRTAADNDALSCDAEHRDPNDWWLHASGCPGSHVTIRATSVEGDELPREVELDAAVLSAKYSKASLGGAMVPINLCRARQVSKPPGAKPGLVQLSGSVKTIKLDWRKEKHRLDRLEAAPR